MDYGHYTHWAIELRTHNYNSCQRILQRFYKLTIIARVVVAVVYVTLAVEYVHVESCLSMGMCLCVVYAQFHITQLCPIDLLFIYIKSLRRFVSWSSTLL